MYLIYYYTIIAVATASIANEKIFYDIDSASVYFENFIKQHNKEYTTPDQRDAAFVNFKRNLADMNAMNNVSNQAVYGINKFSDIDKITFVNEHAGLVSNLINSTDSNFDPYRLCEYVTVAGPSARTPESFDWRKLNKVTKVKEQGVCGSCWAFAAIGNIESQYAIMHDSLIDLSEQQLLDCDRVDQGCDGGLMHLAFQEIIRIGGVEHEIDYPYQGIEYACRLAPSKLAVRLSHCYQYDLRDERKLLELLYKNGPIAVAIDCVDIIDYRSGIATVCNDNGLNHAVLLVGYGIENDTPYWIFKNSWGSNWGENGYFRVRRNINACGMLNEFAASAVLL